MMRLICAVAIGILLVVQILIAGVAVWRMRGGGEARWKSRRVGMEGFGFGKGKEVETRDVVRWA